MKTASLTLILSAALLGTQAYVQAATNTTVAATTATTTLRLGSGQTDALAASRQTMQQAEASYQTALAAAAPGLTNLDAQIDQARQTLMDLQAQRQSLVRTAERSIADVANARDAARDSYMQATRAQMATRAAAMAAQRAAAANVQQ